MFPSLRFPSFVSFTFSSPRAKSPTLLRIVTFGVALLGNHVSSRQIVPDHSSGHLGPQTLMSAMIVPDRIGRRKRIRCLSSKVSRSCKLEKEVGSTHTEVHDLNLKSTQLTARPDRKRRSCAENKWYDGILPWASDMELSPLAHKAMKEMGFGEFGYPWTLTPVLSNVHMLHLKLSHSPGPCAELFKAAIGRAMLDAGPEAVTMQQPKKSPALCLGMIAGTNEKRVVAVHILGAFEFGICKLRCRVLTFGLDIHGKPRWQYWGLKNPGT
ncbi:hypothetical protein B0T20DRAFT_473000 [Sordaria brevicollis]|uniref:Uncharacterized protein n=1 Tax=Sordaria brevicollis TaxID=83679 RepID=A0AAE0U586_SORBR|nr:hypothetical protein B0T20DRAFT_473000 [Sordaria brevicollis]